jgi:serine O-acetyltransferase
LHYTFSENEATNPEVREQSPSSIYGIEKMNLLDLLRSDLDRQYQLLGSSKRANLWRVLGRCLHPRFFPLVLIRAAQQFEHYRVPICPQAIAYFNIILFGIDVAAKCEIGPGLFLPHTSGTVIGASKIGSDVMIFQNVTLGAKYADMGWNIDKRPSVGDRVILGAGCKVLGPVHVGNGSIVAANSVVLADVPENVTVAGNPASVVRSRDLPKDPGDIIQCSI